MSMRSAPQFHARLLIMAAVSCCTALTACRGGAEPQPTAPGHPEPSAAAPSPPRRTVPAVQLAQPSTFELVATTEGALLLWAAGDCQAGVAFQRFDVSGTPIADPGRLDACSGKPAGTIVELAAAAGGGRLGVVWIVRDADGSTALGTFGPDDAHAFAPVLQLGAAEPTAGSPRGQLWLAAAPSGQLRVAWRAPPTPCTGQNGLCAQLVSSALPPQGAAAGRRTDTREVPHPCERMLVGSVWSGGVWYDAFCALDAANAAGVPSTEVYAIKPEIFYAEASPTLRGCAPIGLAPASSGAAVFGMCPAGTRVQLISDAGRSVIEPAARELQCDAGRPILTLRGDRAARESYRLTGPRDRLELWLPSDMAGPGTHDSRVAFTGRKLLIAVLHGDRLGVSSLRCEGETVVSEPPSML